jgi:hypothetical protein
MHCRCVYFGKNKLLNFLSPYRSEDSQVPGVVEERGSRVVAVLDGVGGRPEHERARQAVAFAPATHGLKSRGRPML